MTERSIRAALQLALTQLPTSTTARLDGELLLAHVLQRPRSVCFSRPETELSLVQWQAYVHCLQRRANGEPLAYLTGYQDFWSLTLQVSPAVLVPRADTELLVERALALGPQEGDWTLLDMGTGSGAIALALASERPQWQVWASDISAAALAVAQGNAQRHGLTQLRWLQGAWCAALPAGSRFDCILSNPPYIDASDTHLSGDGLRHEPQQALVAADAGLADLRRIIRCAPAHLREGACLLLEHGHNQGAVVRDLLQATGFVDVCSHRDLGGHERVSQGLWPGRNTEEGR